MTVSDLQSWGQCAGCGTNLWIEPSPNSQRCVCACGACTLENASKLGGAWANVSEATFQQIVDQDLSAGLPE